jgi:cation:H+ antiporter
VALKNRSNQENLLEPVAVKGTKWKNLMILLIGLIGLVGGGYLVVYYGKEIALSLGMSETLVGLTIVAVGTSLPELVTSITAAIKKESEIALGNIIGSNIFNIMFILGASATINPLTLTQNLTFDIVLMISLTLIVLIFSYTHQRKINRLEGLILALVYIAYLIIIIIRN